MVAPNQSARFSEVRTAQLYQIWLSALPKFFYISYVAAF